jgi:hypothetical protein
MINSNSLVAVYTSNVDAESAVIELDHIGFDIKLLSIMGRSYYSEYSVVAQYSYSGMPRSTWRGLRELLFSSTFFWIPDVGPALVAGPLVDTIGRALRTAAASDRVSPIRLGLFEMGIPLESVHKYEIALLEGNCILIASGSEDYLNRAKDTLLDAWPVVLDYH